MEALVENFHLDWKLLLAQAINFAIVVGVLYKFAYRPLLKNMNDRTEVIEKGLKDAKEASEQLEKAEEEKQRELARAKKEAREMLADAQKQAEKNQEMLVNEAREKSEEVVQKAKDQIQGEKEKMLREVKNEVGALVAIAVEKILKEKVDGEKDQKLIQEAVLENEKNV